jgi:predicted Zn finger-like uncharacterized protein
MIIACPACATRYVVPDSAIGAEGRTVRCAKCRHSWFQDGPVLDLTEPAPAAAPATAQREPAREPVAAPPPRSPEVAYEEPAEEAAPSPAEPSYDERDEESLAAPPVYDEPAAPPIYDDPPAPTVVEAAPAPYPEPDPYGEEVSQFDYEPPFRPRRNMMKVWTWAAALFAVLALGTVGAVSYWGLPDWVPIQRPTFALGQPDLVLDFPRDQQERRTLPNGTEYFGASGTVKNVGRETREVPSILIVLRDGRERIVYSWAIAPPKPSLAPGETVTINEAVTDVPRSAKIAEIGWKPA